MMTEEGASFDPVSYINTPRWQTMNLGLDRIRELLAGLGDPQDSLRFVHVAGTNGKGSTCAFLAQILREAGYRVGLFTSPYIVRFEERIRIDGADISAQDLMEATREVKVVADAMSDHPTEFELMTAVAFTHFAKHSCDIVVAEVGLGGRLDSTNVISSVEVSVIAPLSLDHCSLLGDTLPEIATEKAGIIKRGVPVVSALQEDSARDVLSRRAEACHAPLTFVDPKALQGDNTCFSYRSHKNLGIAFAAFYQRSNAALAVEVIDCLRSCGWAIPEEALRAGLAHTSWPGRFEIVHRRPVVILDGAHNGDGARVLADSLECCYPGKKALFVFGVLADKDYSDMVASLCDLAEAVICFAPPNPRALAASDLADTWRRVLRDASETGVPVYEEGGIPQALERAFALADEDDIVCVAGSLYSLGEVKGELDRLFRADA